MRRKYLLLFPFFSLKIWGCLSDKRTIEGFFRNNQNRAEDFSYLPGFYRTNYDLNIYIFHSIALHVHTQTSA